MTDKQKSEEHQCNAGSLLEANFLQFLYGMATQTQIQLGLVENPLTGNREPNLTQAKYSIDLLSIFEEKTKGNLTEEESNYLADILEKLRFCYVDLLQKNSG